MASGQVLMAINERTVAARSTMARVRGSRANQVAVVVAACAAALALAWIVLGPAGTVVLGSAWFLGAGTGRVVPRLRGPAAWAAGIVAEFAIVLGASAVVALVSPHMHGQGVNLAVLAVPLLLGGALLLASARLGGSRAHHQPPSRWGVALSITTGVLARRFHGSSVPVT